MFIYNFIIKKPYVRTYIRACTHGKWVGVYTYTRTIELARAKRLSACDLYSSPFFVGVHVWGVRLIIRCDLSYTGKYVINFSSNSTFELQTAGFYAIRLRVERSPHARLFHIMLKQLPVMQFSNAAKCIFLLCH